MKTNKKFKIFTPIVASSLAFLLGGSLYGQDITNQNCGASINCTDITDNITFKFGNMPESTKIDLTGNTVTFGKEIVTATLKDTGFKTQKFNFPNKTMTVTLDAGKTFNLEAETAVFKGNLVINDTSSGGSNYIGARFTGKFSHGMEGNITVSRTEEDNNRTTLTFNSGNLGSQNNKSTITIQRAGTSENKSKDNEDNNGALVLDFSKNNRGNLYANFRSVNQGGGNVIIKGYNNNTITTTLYGNIGEQELGSPDTKTLTITFENAKMVGNIGHTFNVNGSGQAQGNTQKQANDFQKRVVIFKNSASQATSTRNTEPNYVLTGNINSFGTGYANNEADKNKGNHVIFEHGSMKGNIFASRFGYRTGYNEVIFKDANTTFFGTIRVAGSFQSKSTNDVTFNGATNTLKANGNNNDVILSNGNGCDIHNNCQHSVIGSNNITFKNTTTKNTIEGNITTEAGINNVIFEDNTTNAQNNSIGAIIAMGLRNYEFNAFGGTNNITFQNHSGSNTIGSVSALKGTNNIIFGTSAKAKEAKEMPEMPGVQSLNNTITGDITANGGTNKISMNGTNTIAGTIRAGNGGYEGNNYLYFSGDKTTIGNTTENAKAIATSIIANNGSNNNTNKYNFLKLESKTNTITLNSLEALGGNKAKNIISLDNTSMQDAKSGEVANALTITTISSNSGINYIGKNILNKNGGNEANLTDNTSKIFDSPNQASGTLIATTIASTNGNNKINIETLALQDSGKIDANGSSYNQINVKNLSTKQNATSRIIARWGGTNKIAASDSVNLNLSALTAGEGNNDKNPNNINIISLDNTSMLSAKSGEVANALTITTISSNSGNNFIGKGILSGSGTDLNNNTSMTFTDAANAFEGVLQVGSMESSNGGMNNISYKASVNILGATMKGRKQESKAVATQNAIIGSLALNNDEATKAKNLLKTAISGNNNLYLDLSANTDFADVSNLIKNEASPSQTLKQESLLSKTQAVILGNIDNQGRANNIKIVGGSDANTSGSTSGTTMMATQAAEMANTHIKIGLVGNITTNGGNNNLIFENSIWLPSYIAATDMKKAANISLPENLSGTLTNSNNGTTNIVLRTSSATLNNLGASMFNVDNQSGNVNIVIQGQVNVGANVSYANNTGGGTTFIFANSNDMNGSAKDNFTNGSTDVSNANSKVLGVTYQDGIKLTLKDKSIGGGSFLGTYAHYFNNVAENNSLLTLTTNRKYSSNAQTDTITIKGLALGNIIELSPSNKTRESGAQSSTTTYNYNVTLDKNSAFVGNITLQENSNVTLTMNEGSKLLTDSNHLKINTLTISTTKGVNTNEILLNTFAQSNTIIDIATINPDGSLATNNNGSLNPATRQDFRLLEIGKDSMQKEKVKMDNNSNGLQGNGAIFRVYMNDSAKQNEATLGDIKAQNGTQESRVENTQTDESGQYGHLYSDRILILSGNVNSNSDATKVNYIQVLADASTQLESIKYHGGGTETKDNIAVATVKGTNDQQVAKFEGAAQIQGFDVVGTTLTTATTDQYGKIKNGMDSAGNNYTTYFVNSMTSRGASESIQSASQAALGSNYFMYMANINSLNKRMGELRYNANAQGVWARVFNGMLSSDLHTANTKSIYTTFQTGYDYAFGMEGANDYLGFAVSYINAINDSQSKLDIDGLQKGVKDSLSNGVEVAIYNAYVQDGASKANGFKNGLYTDTILKFSFMNNKLHMFGQTDDYSINNFAFTFSQEAGYRFLLGNHDEWFIDPQAELTIGFFDQSEFVQKLGNNYLIGTQNAILNIRGRVGSNFGYKFDHLTENKGFTSQLYLGMYYVGNYTSGGDGALVSNLGSKTTLNALTSHSSFLINVGTNFTIKDKHRIYFDFERSFFGPIVTNYQVNLGYRFSFGESKYTPLATNLANEIKKAKEVKAKAEEVKKK